MRPSTTPPTGRTSMPPPPAPSPRKIPATTVIGSSPRKHQGVVIIPASPLVRRPISFLPASSLSLRRSPTNSGPFFSPFTGRHSPPFSAHTGATASDTSTQRQMHVTTSSADTANSAVPPPFGPSVGTATGNPGGGSLKTYVPPDWGAPPRTPFYLSTFLNGAPFPPLDLTSFGLATLTIGRLPSSVLTFSHPSLSRQHAIIQFASPSSPHFTALAQTLPPQLQESGPDAEAPVAVTVSAGDAVSGIRRNTSQASLTSLGNNSGSGGDNRGPHARGGAPGATTRGA